MCAPWGGVFLCVPECSCGCWNILLVWATEYFFLYFTMQRVVTVDCQFRMYKNLFFYVLCCKTLILLLIPTSFSCLLFPCVNCCVKIMEAESETCNILLLCPEDYVWWLKNCILVSFGNMSMWTFLQGSICFWRLKERLRVLSLCFNRCGLNLF